MAGRLSWRDNTREGVSTGVEAFDRARQVTNLWLRNLMAQPGTATGMPPILHGAFS